MKAMKTLTIGGQTFEVVDEAARAMSTVQTTEVNQELTLTKVSDKVMCIGGYSGSHANTGLYYGYAPVIPGDRLVVTGYQPNTSYYPAVYIFNDADGNNITYGGGTEEGKTYTFEVTVPDNAVEIIVNGKENTEVSVYGVTVTTVYNIGKAYNDIKELQVKAEEIDDKASVEYVNNATTVIKTLTDHEYKLDIVSGLIKTANGTQSHNNGLYGTAAVTPGDTIQVTAYQWVIEYGFCGFFFYDADGNVIDQNQGETSTKAYTVTVTVPEGATKIAVNGHIHDCKLAVIGECTKIVGFSGLYDEVAELKAEEKTEIKLITLGDSITMLGTGNTGWIKYFIEKTGCELVANVAMNSAVLSDYSDTSYDGNPQQSNQTNNVLGNQVQKIINNGYDAPDIIMIAIGTNGGIHITKDQIKAAYYDSNNALIPLANVDRTTNAGAYRWCLDKLHETYPNALIFWCTPIMGCQTIRSAENAMSFAESLRIATEYTGQIMIDTIRCGINGINEVNGANGQYLIDGLHPNVNGAKKIGYYNASKVIPFIGNNFELT